MNWTLAIVIGVVFLALLVLKRLAFVSPKVARRLLAEGALVIDVRSSGEFNSGHLPAAINIPLGEIETALPRQMKDKSLVLLLHCLSGGCSGIAKRQLKGMGYSKVYNLGSYGRARQIVQGMHVS